MEQYLRFFTEHRQRNWSEWLVIVEFVINNKVYAATKILSFIANYRRELMMGTDIRGKEKIEKVTKFVERMKKV